MIDRRARVSGAARRSAAARWLTATALSLSVAGPVWSQSTTATGSLNTVVQVQPRPIADVRDCEGLDADIRRYRQRILTPMRRWAIEALGHFTTEALLYPFSGPDAVTALALFPEVRHLTMLSLQRASLEQLEAVDDETIAAECDIHRFFTQTGFFRTLDLDGKERPAAPRLLALLLLSLETAGVRVSSISPIQMDTDGTIQEDASRKVVADVNGLFQPPDRRPTDSPEISRPSARPNGVRIEGTDNQGRGRTIDYLSIDLSNAGISRRSMAHRMIESLAHDAVIVKSGSHLLQSRNFSNLARIIAGQARLVVQDETGLDIELLNRFDQIAIHGDFTEPFEFWRDSESMARLKAFVDFYPPSKTPPFPFGYRKPSGTLIMVGSSKRDRGTTAPETDSTLKR